jgi:hypothetical protein
MKFDDSNPFALPPAETAQAKKAQTLGCVGPKRHRH